MAELLEFLAQFVVVDLVFRGRQDGLQRGEDLRGETENGLVLLLVQTEDSLPDRRVFLVVVLERQDAHKRGEDIAHRNAILVLGDHAADATSSIILASGFVESKEGLQLLQHGRISLDDLSVGVALLDEATDGVGSIAAGLSILVAKAVEEQFQERRGVRCHSGAHASNAFGEDADGSRALDGLAAASVAEHSLLEDLPELSEAAAEGNSHAGNDIQGGVDDNPVEFRGLLQTLDVRVGLDGGAEDLGEVILLTGVLLVDDAGDNGDDVLEDLRRRDKVGTAELEVLSDVAVDLGNGLAVCIVRISPSRMCGNNQCIRELESGVIKRVYFIHNLCVKVSWVT